MEGCALHLKTQRAIRSRLHHPVSIIHHHQKNNHHLKLIKLIKSSYTSTYTYSYCFFFGSSWLVPDVRFPLLNRQGLDEMWGKGYILISDGCKKIFPKGLVNESPKEIKNEMSSLWRLDGNFTCFRLWLKSSPKVKFCKLFGKVIFSKLWLKSSSKGKLWTTDAGLNLQLWHVPDVFLTSVEWKRRGKSKGQVEQRNASKWIQKITKVSFAKNAAQYLSISKIDIRKAPRATQPLLFLFRPLSAFVMRSLTYKKIARCCDTSPQLKLTITSRLMQRHP